MDKQDVETVVMIFNAYKKGRISLGRAAEILGYHREELKEIFVSQGVEIREGCESIEEARDELKAIDESVERVADRYGRP